MAETANNQSISFETDHLLSKYGFADGELLADFLRENGYDHLDEESDEWNTFSRRVLCEVVECFVCPHIENRIKPYRMLTSHNPIRIYEVDGRHLSDWNAAPQLQPFTISVAKEAILATAASLYATRCNDSGEITSYMVRSEQATAVAQQHGWD